VGRATFKRTGRIVNSTLGLGQNVGTAVAKHANATVKNVLRRKNRKNSRRNRRDTRRNRK
jgi:hypothetical protein